MPIAFLQKHSIPLPLLVSSYEPTEGGGEDTNPTSELMGEVSMVVSLQHTGLRLQPPPPGSPSFTLAPEKKDVITPFEGWGNQDAQPPIQGQ